MLASNGIPINKAYVLARPISLSEQLLAVFPLAEIVGKGPVEHKDQTQ